MQVHPLQPAVRGRPRATRCTPVLACRKAWCCDSEQVYPLQPAVRGRPRDTRCTPVLACREAWCCDSERCIEENLVDVFCSIAGAKSGLQHASCLLVLSLEFTETPLASKTVTTVMFPAALHREALAALKVAVASSGLSQPVKPSGSYRAADVAHLRKAAWKSVA